MCDIQGSDTRNRLGVKTIPVEEAVGMVLAHDITEIKQEDFKGRAFKKGHIVKEEDISRLQRLGKENLFVLNIAEDEVHEDDAAYAMANALMGKGVKMEGEPKEGKINIIADRDGLLKINKDELFRFNMLGDVMCATLHNNTPVRKGQLVGGTRAIPLVVKKNIVEDAVATAGGKNVIEVKKFRKPKVGVVITGNEVYYGRIKDAFAPVITKKIKSFDGEIVGIYYAPDDEGFIEARLKELVEAGADLLITTGGMSVDPDDVTRFAIRNFGAEDISYGSAVLPGAMFLVAYISAEEQKSGRAGVTSELPNFRTSEPIPILGIPACGMYHKTTIFDLILPRVLAGEKITRKELAELGHGGLCLNCKECRYPVCPFGK
ncbi:MAG: molybdopterin-binding protein [Nitrospirae bacterium]|nr:molybdopterin-binding protein [Nitrospirota bacterium]MCL5976794.1 molybdopterin-binding protein [Nitrospirota bacterium]